MEEVQVVIVPAGTVIYGNPSDVYNMTYFQDNIAQNLIPVELNMDLKLMDSRDTRVIASLDSLYKKLYNTTISNLQWDVNEDFVIDKDMIDFLKKASMDLDAMGDDTDFLDIIHQHNGLVMYKNGQTIYYIYDFGVMGEGQDGFAMEIDTNDFMEEFDDQEMSLDEYVQRNTEIFDSIMINWDIAL